MYLKVIKTVSKNYKIVDDTDDDAPLISFHNECNKPEIVEKVLRALVDYFTDEALKQ